MLYMVTFTINIPPMLAYIPYMDPMGTSNLPYFTYLYVFFFADSCHLYPFVSIAFHCLNPFHLISCQSQWTGMLRRLGRSGIRGLHLRLFASQSLTKKPPRRFDAPWPGMLGQSGAWLPWRRLQPASLYGLVPQRAQRSKCQWRTGRRIFLDPLKMVLM